MPRTTQATKIAAMEQEIADLKALIAEPVAAKASVPTFIEGTRDDAGNVAGGFACSAGKVDGKACKRLLRTSKRASKHGVDEGGHEFRA